ncbi:hypothetical protein [Croceivirga radicis]|uniref:hypothetical protein n=1 Tax=Croceivirga radicis TaxID=1929488 RepID=UPI0012FF4244|nr:hypothetical protein [Croceivirga radicis]
MKIIWDSSELKLDDYSRLNIEYALNLEVTLVLIKNAEHFLDYKSLITLQIKNGHVLIDAETPQPIAKKLKNNLIQLQDSVSKLIQKDLVAWPSQLYAEAIGINS